MSRRLTLIAGSGGLVPIVLDAARARYVATQVVDLVGREDLIAERVIRRPVSSAKAIAGAVLDFRSSDLVLAGRVALGDSDRRSIASALGLPGRLARSFGDVSLAGALLLHFRLAGVRVLGAHQLIPHLLAPEGLIAGPPVLSPVADHARSALVAAREVGRLDLGQAVVSAGRRLVAAEDAGGTDELIDRVARLRALGLVGGTATKLILAKALKPQQPRFVDLPAIGAETVNRAAAAGIEVIAVETQKTLVLERELVRESASTLGVSVIGLRLSRG